MELSQACHFAQTFIFTLFEEYNHASIINYLSAKVLETFLSIKKKITRWNWQIMANVWFIHGNSHNEIKSRTPIFNIEKHFVQKNQFIKDYNQCQRFSSFFVVLAKCCFSCRRQFNWLKINFVSFHFILYKYIYLGPNYQAGYRWQCQFIIVFFFCSCLSSHTIQHTSRSNSEQITTQTFIRHSFDA